MSAAKREKFIFDQIFNMTLSATVQRSVTYQKNTVEKDRIDFRRNLQTLLMSLSSQYRKPVSEAAHCENIEALAKEITKKFGSILHGRRFRIGSAQKALNLYLKYLWCLGRIELPPHCPIDSIILDEIAKESGSPKISWTKLDSITQYEEIICKAKKIAGRLPLSEWELELYLKKTNGI